MRADENDFSHPIFPYMAESSDVLSSILHYNKSYLKDLWTHGSYKLELSHERWFRTGDSLHIFPFDHGLKVAPDTADSQLLYLQQEEKKSFAPSAVSYLKLIAEYCMKNDIRLYFLYLPSYAEIEREPGFSRSYESMGELWVPPKEILLNKDHWFDKEHLNTTGSRALSRWLCERLNDELNSQN